MSTEGPENKNFPSAYEQYNAQQMRKTAGQSPNSSYEDYRFSNQNTAGRGLGIASVILGILALLSGWIFIGGLFGLIGLVLGIISLSQAKKNKSPKGLAIAGMVLSILGILCTIVMVVLVAVVLKNYDIFGAIDACQQYQNNQQQLQECVYEYWGIENPSPSSGATGH